MNYFFVVGGDIQMEISELIFSHHFSINDVRPPKKKTNRRRPERLKHHRTDSDGGDGGNGKTVPSNSADSWISKIERIQTLR
jgi:hypothetical protein